MDNLLLKFFLPAFDGSIHAVLQLTFAAIFVAAVVLVPRLVKRAATSERWERNLVGANAKAGGTTSHETVEALAAAAATPAERWADALPSLLLVFGLLGTFIGLGLALTEAAGALGSQSDALSSLTPIMNSLGSKFKTSTWGILAFLSLKIWFMLRPYEEARLAWAARKIEARTAEAEALRARQGEDERRQLIDAIAQAGGAMVAEQQRSTQLAGTGHAQSLDVLQRIAEGQDKAAFLLQETARQQSAALAQVEQRLAETAEHSAATRLAMENFVHGVSDNISKMAGAADNMASAAQSAGQASSDLGSVIAEFRGQMVAVLGEVKHGLTETIDRMSATFGVNMGEMSADLSRATTGIGNAISQLSGGVAETITMLNTANQESIARQAKAQATFTASGEELMASMGTMQAFVQEMQTSITTGLQTVAKASQQTLAFEKHLLKNHEQTASLLAQTEKLALGIEKTTAGLQNVATLGEEVRVLVAAIEWQGRAQAEASQRYQQQHEVSERVVAQLVPLTGAITALAASLQEQHAGQAQARRLAADNTLA